MMYKKQNSTRVDQHNTTTTHATTSCYPETLLQDAGAHEIS